MIPEINRTTRPKKPVPLWVFKVQWDSTAIFHKVLAKNQQEAEKKLARELKRTEGGDGVRSISLVRVDPSYLGDL